MLLNVQLQIGCSTFKQIVQCVLPSAWMHFLTSVTRELVTLQSTAALLMLLAALRISWNSSSLMFTLCTYTIAFMWPHTW